MKSRKFTLIEMLVVIAIIGILASMLMGPIQRAVKSSRKTACTNNLAQIGKAVFLYESPSAFDAAPLRVAAASGSEATNPVTLAPLVALAAAGYVDTAKLVACPLGETDFKATDFSDADVGLTTQKDKAASALVPSANGKAASQYLFTLYYSKGSVGNRAIAGDAGDATATGDSSFSPNHGDRADSKNEGANVLFKDGHVKASKTTYTSEDAADTTNLWGDIASGGKTTDKLTQIGHY